LNIILLLSLLPARPSSGSLILLWLIINEHWYYASKKRHPINGPRAPEARHRIWGETDQNGLCGRTLVDLNKRFSQHSGQRRDVGRELV
jgi:hypothetical protein